MQINKRRKNGIKNYQSALLHYPAVNDFEKHLVLTGRSRVSYKN
jgi:hypothetical protein